MNLIMMGTGEFATPTFRRLLDGGYSVSLLVTQPDRPQGRHQELTPAAIKVLAVDRGVAVFQPESINTPESIARVAALQPDLLVVAAYGQILSDDLLRVPHLGGVNLHASLLPKYRGAAPINWAIYHGEAATGVTVIQMTPHVDAGAILLQAETAIGPDETAGELEVRLAELGAPLVSSAIDTLAAGSITGRPQVRSQATRAPKLKKEHGLIDWSRPAVAVANQIRAMQPWPMPYTFLYRPDGAIRLTIERARPDFRLARPPDRPVGSAAVVEAGRMLVWASDVAVNIEQLRPAGKRSMSAAEFLRGRPLTSADCCGPEQVEFR
jgi:methionyl-tRNA formyltransferase